MKSSSTSQQQRSLSTYLNAKSRHNLLLTVICSLGLIFASCGSDSTGPDPNGGNGGNGGNNGNEEPPAEPIYANVQDIFTGSCGGSGCHIGESTNGVRLDSYANVINSVGVQYGENVVKPDSAAGSPLVDKIESSSPREGQRMPLGGPYLSSDNINLIKEWINNGAENE